ncbi:MAG TPA: hypothetical protein DCG51_06245 [Erysipelotrichaceae bacterium]|jgi:hypothetical protein|nr:hypothetical protein [Erysipelotrichaceae bacterium]
MDTIRFTFHESCIFEAHREENELYAEYSMILWMGKGRYVVWRMCFVPDSLKSAASQIREWLDNDEEDIQIELQGDTFALKLTLYDDLRLVLQYGQDQNAGFAEYPLTYDELEQLIWMMECADE